MARQKYTKGDFSVVPNKNTLRGQPAFVQAVYFWICHYADENGHCWPSRSLLGKDAGVSTSSIDRAIVRLTELGVLHKHMRLSEKGDPDTNVYTIMLVEGGSVTQKLPLFDTSNSGGGSVSVKPGSVTQRVGGSVTQTHRTIKNKELYKRGGLIYSRPEIEKELREFVEDRKFRKAPVSQLALTRIEGELQRLYPDDFDAQKESIAQSIINGWKGVFPVKDYDTRRHQFDDRDKWF